ncbi:hypothetical protein os1_31740 [Comamonadaceae bacterium OS-1]|nr:hypothetical protein os1_31740 [Comamonadaceae bacterium OS-1]
MAFLNSVGSWLNGVVLGVALVSSPAQVSAVVLSGTGPSSVLAGQQSDGGTTPYVESINVTGPAAITGITWWGYYLTGEDAGTDSFLINGSSLAAFPAVVRTDVGDLDDGSGGTVNLYQYFLNLSGVNAQYFAGGPTDLGILNDSLDVEWFWQGSTTDLYGPRAYLVQGDLLRQEVPEPSSIALFGLALAALGVARARKLH